MFLTVRVKITQVFLLVSRFSLARLLFSFYLLSHDVDIYAVTIQSSHSRDFPENAENNALTDADETVSQDVSQLSESFIKFDGKCAESSKLIIERFISSFVSMTWSR